MNAFDIINQNISNTVSETHVNITHDYWYVLGNTMCNSRIPIWISTLLTAISELDIDEIDRDMAYFYAKSTNAPFQSIMETISTPEARNDSASDRQFIAIRKAYGNTIQNYMRSKIVHILKRIYSNTMGICEKSDMVNRSTGMHNLIPLELEARSAEYVRTIIRRMQEYSHNTDQSYSDVSPFTRDVDALLTAVRGYRFAEYANHKQYPNSVGAGHLTSEDMMNLMRIAHLVAHSTSFEAIRLVARIYLIVQLFTGYSTHGSVELDYNDVKQEMMNHVESSHNRMKLATCRSLSGVNAMVPVCFMGVFNQHISSNLSGRTISPTNPDSLAERLMFYILYV